MPSSGDFVQGVRVSGYWSKWLTFSAATLVMLSAGLGYTFSVWSNMLKTHFSYSQTQVAGVGTACNLGGYLGILAGPFYDMMRPHSRMGPWLTLNIGVLIHLGGYLSLWAAAKGFFTPPYWAMVLLAMLACNGQTWFETGALVTCVRNFETERGTVIGVLKAFLGLSASLYTTLYMGFLDPDATSFLLLLALGPALTVLLCSIVINYVPYIQVEPHTKSHAFHLAFTAVVGLAAYQAAIAFARNSGAFQFWAGFLVTCAIAMLLLPILSIPWIFGGLFSRRLDSDLDHSSSKKALRATQYPELVPFMADEGSDDEQQDDVDERFQDVYRDKTPIKCLRSQSFWMLFFINAIGSGAGLTLNNNLAQQVLALDPKSNATTVFVSVFSVASCVGRLCSGSLPDKWMRERGVPRTVSLVGLMVCTMLTAALNAFITLPLMPVSAFLTGFTFGGMQGVVPAVTSEIFGLRNFATNYALVQLGPATGSYTLATFLAGHLYEQRGRAHGDPAGTCRGRDCFRWTFIVVTGLSGVAAAVSLLLWRRTQHLYAKVVEHTRLERQRRGLAGEVAERRKIMRRVMEENKLLQSYLTRGRDMVAQLVAQLRDESVDKAAAVEQGLSQLQALGFEASELLSMQAEMYEQFEKLSPQAQ
eukprot:jgi/Botrbrau1/20749/Bobra.0058s0077.1